jgi:hypothetical protein
MGWVKNDKIGNRSKRLEEKKKKKEKTIVSKDRSWLRI